MSLYGALKEVLIDLGPLPALYLFRLPDESVNDVDVACIPISGVGARRYLGERIDSSGISDGGILWFHKGVQFLCRGADPEYPQGPKQTADDILSIMIQFAGGSDVYQGEEIVRCEVATAPVYLGQDDLGRSLSGVTLEIWHRPALA